MIYHPFHHMLVDQLGNGCFYDEYISQIVLKRQQWCLCSACCWFSSSTTDGSSLLVEVGSADVAKSCIFKWFVKYGL